MSVLSRSTRAVTVCFALAIAAPAAAQVTYNNGAPNGQAGFDIFNDYRAADDFSVSGTLAFDVIRFWALAPTGSLGASTIFWQILGDAGGVPGSALTSGAATATTTLRTSPVAGFDSWQFELAVGPQLFGSGVFWLALHDGALGDITDSSLLWEATDAQHGARSAVDFIPASEWSGDFGDNLAFELIDSAPVTATPEPATITLFATGFVAIAAVGRRRRHTRSR